MKSSVWTFVMGVALVVAASCGLGCGGPDPMTDRPAEVATGGEPVARTAKEKKIDAARAKLSPEDRALVDAQDYCAVMPKQKLGSMGVPLKLTIKGRPVFVCCKGCKGKAEDAPDETLEAVEKLKAKSKKQ